MDEIDGADAVSEYLGIPAKTLAQWRYLAKGPAYAKIGKHVRYRRSDVDAWLAARVVPPRSTDGRAA
jgi:excisionase family DNA binding protein